MYSVYIVDDESLMIKSLITSIPWLENGFEVIGSHTNAQAALTEIMSLKPDVVFCDLKMPIYDGIELIKCIKENEVDTEFIMLSAFGEFEASRSFFLLEGFDYILKPLKPADAEIVLEKLSRKLAEKYHQTPSIAFVSSQTKNFDDLVAYVTTNFNKKHSLKDLSIRFNLNSTYICNLFSKHYESTLTIFITNLRMKEAGKLILGSDASLKEIANACGYPNYFHFCKVFKSHFGVPPTQYREDAK